MRNVSVATRKVLAWRLGRPKIFNTNQGRQFASFAFTVVLKDADTRIRIGGCGR